MLFSEIYSAYYNTVASIIARAQKGELDSDSIYKIVHESAFPESYLTIGSALDLFGGHLPYEQIKKY